MYKHFFKRVFDFIIVLVALLLISWLMVLIAIVLHFANQGAGAFSRRSALARMPRFSRSSSSRTSQTSPAS